MPIVSSGHEAKRDMTVDVEVLGTPTPGDAELSEQPLVKDLEVWMLILDLLVWHRALLCR